MKTAQVWARAIMLYGLAMVLMIACWTLILYLDQEYPSPAYRMSFSNCVRNAAVMTPMNGAGPLVFLIYPYALMHQPFWVLPIFGAIIYAIIAALLGRFGGRWPAWLHVFIGVFWLFAGAIVAIASVHK